MWSRWSNLLSQISDAQLNWYVGIHAETHSYVGASKNRAWHTLPVLDSCPTWTCYYCQAGSVSLSAISSRTHPETVAMLPES